MKTILFPGRFQPWHEGHQAVVSTLLQLGYQVVIGVRDTEQSASNPYSLEERMVDIWAQFNGDDPVRVVPIPDFDEIAFGREPGWGVHEVRLPADVEAIRATDRRQ